MKRPDMQAQYGNPSEGEIVDYASGLYEDISESYEALKKDPDANIGIKPLDIYLPGDGGINRYFYRRQQVCQLARPFQWHGIGPYIWNFCQFLGL